MTTLSNYLRTTYAKTPSPVFARYVLKSCKQQVGESFDAYLQSLKRLSLDCNFRAVSAVVHKEEAIRDAFISGMISNEIRQRLLENQDLTLAWTVEKARTLELAQRNARLFNLEYLQQTLANPNCSKTSTAPESFDKN